MRILMTLALLLFSACAAIAQQDATGEARIDLATARTLHVQADYMRELWVALPPRDVEAGALLAAMRDACDDTTTVAVLEVNLAEGVAGSPDEQITLRTVAVRKALQDLKSALPFDDRHTRLVLVGVLDSCSLAARVAIRPETQIEGLALIDPPVADLQLPDGLRRAVGVDALIHPRSENEWQAQQTQLLDSLGSWGRSARVIRSRGHFDTLAQRISELRLHTRDYRVLVEGQETALRAGDLAKQLSDFDVVIVGELHGNPGAHRVQLEMLRHYAGDGRTLALATEQFERDVQHHLDGYLSAMIDEQDFLAEARPWPNYADYRPLVELCRTQGVPVLAANIPRRLASRVFKETPAVIDSFSKDEKAWSARELKAYRGAYRDKFMRAMGATDGHNANLENMYAAQCIKDDTMAESIHDWLQANPGARVLHINGNFHSAGGLGVPEKLKALNPELKIALVTCIPRGEEQEAAENEWILTVPAPRPRRE